ncbi:MAG: CheR family methyltransferase [Halanaerobiales bacterium]
MPLNFDEFKEKAIKILNLNLNGYKIKRVKRRTDSLMRRHDIKNYSECLDLLKNDLSFRTVYLNHLTINTSEFFRNPENFNYLQNNILPDLMKNKNKVKIWSAPCSNGSEPYTIAIILTEMGYNSSHFIIKASDIDSQILETAKQGIYTKNYLKNVPDPILNKYFNKISDNKYQLKTKIINKVAFEKKDLIKEPYEKGWDIILCRNFFIYLTREIKQKLTTKFVKALTSEGYLFLGNTEFIFNPGNYNLNKEHSSFYKKLS